MLQRLAWRFKAAVEEWIVSDKLFHIMWDWWTHTDLILAGMWGGIANILPSMEKMIAEYKPQRVETTNIDQHFLRDSVWPLLQNYCFIHDRCFRGDNTTAWPLASPQGNRYVGENVFVSQREEQEKRLRYWIRNLKDLQ